MKIAMILIIDKQMLLQFRGSSVMDWQVKYLKGFGKLTGPNSVPWLGESTDASGEKFRWVTWGDGRFEWWRRGDHHSQKHHVTLPQNSQFAACIRMDTLQMPLHGEPAQTSLSFPPLYSTETVIFSFLPWSSFSPEDFVGISWNPFRSFWTPWAKAGNWLRDHWETSFCGGGRRTDRLLHRRIGLVPWQSNAKCNLTSTKKYQY